MSHSLTKIWIHGVFCTQNREPIITGSNKIRLYEHITGIVENDLVCKLRIINGVDDHIHVLFLLNPNCSPQEAFKKIKGNSSHWWNEQQLTKEHFAWQIGYGAFSVSESQLRRVEEYVKNQEAHHRTMTYEQEIKLLESKHRA